MNLLWITLMTLVSCAQDTKFGSSGDKKSANNGQITGKSEDTGGVAEKDSELGSEKGSDDNASGSGAGKDGPKPEEITPNLGSDSSSDSVATPCVEGKALTKLITPSVQNGVVGNYLEYTLEAYGCDGKPKPLGAGAVLFDIDSIIDLSSANSPVRVEITDLDKGTPVYADNFTQVQGSDLFGKKGDSLFHYTTGKWPALKEGRIRVKVLLMGRRFGPTQAPTPSNSTGPYTFASYFKLFELDPLKINVQFK